jgi:hypothetical protein
MLDWPSRSRYMLGGLRRRCLPVGSWHRDHLGTLLTILPCARSSGPISRYALPIRDHLHHFALPAVS